jgi:hypothetical protein
MYWMWKWFGLTPWVDHAFSLFLHILNTWMVFAVGLAWPRVRAAAFWAASFFAVAEGHQEAVMWFSAINELWLFLFGAVALWCWAGDRWWGVFPFALALLSKESAPILLPLFWLVAPQRDWRKWLPYAALAALVIASIWLTQSSSFRFSDGSFSWRAPFWITWPRGVVRLLWIWGWIAALAVFFLGDRQARSTAFVTVAWIAIALLPYSFLTYSTEIPSRQTYLASAGLAYLAGLGMSLLPGRRVLAAVAALILVHNVGYLATRKRQQFLERAAPTEQLIRFARQTNRPVWVRCFPRNAFIATEAVHLGAGRQPSDLVWSEPEARARGAAEFCYSPGRSGA